MQLLERQGQLQQLASAHAAAVSGNGRLVAVAGEAGAGKTSLVERFARDCTADNKAKTQIYWGGCEHLSTPEPLLPLRDIARTSGDHFCYDPNTDRLSTFEAVLQLIGIAQAAVLILEDVQWADAATLDLIRYLARRVRRTRALVVITYREEEIGRNSLLRQLLGEAPRDSVERLHLASLSLSAVTLLARNAGRDGKALYTLTGGNPFFVTEALAVESDTTSDAVRDATLARAAQLPVNARRLLQLVSIFPRHANAELVSELVREDFEPALDACADKGMLTVDGDNLKFRHEIARRAIQDSLAPAHRRSLHQRLVDILTVRTGTRASEIAHHAERAEDSATLAKYAELAGEDAAQASAPREAATHFPHCSSTGDPLPTPRWSPHWSATPSSPTCPAIPIHHSNPCAKPPSCGANAARKSLWVATWDG